jgi:hypothetical protein
VPLGARVDPAGVSAKFVRKTQKLRVTARFAGVQ